MLLIYNEKTNPYFNLAMEEYLLKNFDEDLFILWRNEPSIIVGKNRNTLSEINLEYIKNILYLSLGDSLVVELYFMIWEI